MLLLLSAFATRFFFFMVRSPEGLQKRSTAPGASDGCDKLDNNIIVTFREEPPNERLQLR